MHVLRRVLVVAFITSIAHLGVFVPSPVSAREVKVLCPVECQRWVDAAIARQARGYVKFLASSWYASVIAGSSVSICIANHESATSGLYGAENPISTASGKYQTINSTWDAIQVGRGTPELMGHAADNDWIQQELSFQWAIDHWGLVPWAGTGC